MIDRAAPSVRPEVVVALVGCVLLLVLVSIGFPAPRVDDGWFKGPAAELALNGRLASPAITGFFPHIDEVFACYPPLPPFLLAGWYSAVGVSLRSSLAWSLLVHVGFCVAVSGVAYRCLGAGSVPAWRASVLGGLAWLANVSLLDRQEELGLCWLWVDTLFAFRDHRRPAALAAARTGFLVGLAALSSPFSGLLSACAVGMRIVLSAWEHPPAAQTSRARAALADVAHRGAIAGLLASSIFGMWVLAAEYIQPGVFESQFLEAMRWASNDPPFPGNFPLYVSTLVGSVQIQIFVLPVLLVTLLATPVALAERPHRIPAALFGAGLVGLWIVLGFRPAAYTYLWASAMVLAPCFAVAWHRYLTGEPRLALGIGLALCAFAWVDPARNVVAASTLPEAEKPDEVIAALREAIPPRELVAVTARHWSAFQGRNPWREVIFLTRRNRTLLADCDWMVLREGEGLDRPPQLPEYDLVKIVPSSAVDADLTFAYSVWKHRR